MKKYVKLVLLVLWLGVIYFFSNQTGQASKEVSNGLLENIAFILNIKEIAAFILKYEVVIRKFAHIFEYLVLGILVYINLNEYTNKDIFVLAVILCAIYATSDEIHQLFVSERAFMFIDILIDTLGSLIGCFLAFLVCKNVTKRKGA